MNQREIWLRVYTLCRQINENHVTACENADAAVEKTKLLNNDRPN